MIDARLLVPAGAAWLAAVTAVSWLTAEPAISDRHARSMLVLVAGAVVGGAVLVGSLALRSQLTGRPRLRIVVVGAVGIVLGVVSSAAHVVALTADPVAGWIDARATAEVSGVLVGEPVTRSSPRAPVWAAHSRLEVRLATQAVGARGVRVDAGLPMLVRLPANALVPPPGTKVVLVGRLSPPLRTDDAAVLTLDATREHLRAVADPGPIDGLTHAMRTGLRTALTGVQPEAAALVAGPAVGDEGTAPAELSLDMRSSGLSHLTAVSGGNVAVVVVSVLGLAAVVRMSLVGRVGAALAALAFFVMLVGPQPSVIRAAVMGGLVLLEMLTGGRRAGPAVLSTCVLILVVLSPAVTASWGFALSAGATTGLILLSPRMAEQLARWPVTARWPPALREALAVTTAAQVATAPLLLAMGATVGWVALPANLLAMPVVAPITVLGLLAALLSPAVPAAASVMAHLAAPLASWKAGVAHACAGLPGSVVPWPSGWRGVACLVGCLIVLGLGHAVIRRAFPEGVPGGLRRVALGLTGALLALWILVPPARRDWPPPGWALIMCDVGQGDALLMRVADATAVVVDTGPDPDRVDRCLADAGITVVPAVVLTHFHSDHVGGLAGVFRGRSVASVLVTPVRDPPLEAEAVDAVLMDEGMTATVVSAGDARAIGPVRWRTVWPRRVILTGSVPNNASVVLLARMGDLSAALLGDVEPEAQAAIGPDLAADHFDVVKVPHHGSRYFDSRLPSWAPAPVALISVGAGNDYGHPADSTIAAWRAIGALVARTDELGDVAVVDRAGSGVGVVVRHGMLPSS